MNILTLTEAQEAYKDAVKSDEPEAGVVRALLLQLISHLDTANKVVQIASDGESIIALKGDGSMFVSSAQCGWIEQPPPMDMHKIRATGE